jgi:hypothetical protein
MAVPGSENDRLVWALLLERDHGDCGGSGDDVDDDDNDVAPAA